MEEKPPIEDRSVIKVAADKVLFFFFLKGEPTQLDNKQRIADVKVALKSLKVPMDRIIFTTKISIIGALDEILNDW